MAIPLGYYACEHQSSDEPCDICQPGEPTMPEDWRDDYVPPTNDVPEESVPDPVEE